MALLKYLILDQWRRNLPDLWPLKATLWHVPSITKTTMTSLVLVCMSTTFKNFKDLAMASCFALPTSTTYNIFPSKQEWLVSCVSLWCRGQTVVLKEICSLTETTTRCSFGLVFNGCEASKSARTSGLKRTTREVAPCAHFLYRAQTPMVYWTRVHLRFHINPLFLAFYQNKDNRMKMIDLLFDGIGVICQIYACVIQCRVFLQCQICIDAKSGCLR